MSEIAEIAKVVSKTTTNSKTSREATCNVDAMNTTTSASKKRLQVAAKSSTKLCTCKTI